MSHITMVYNDISLRKEEEVQSYAQSFDYFVGAEIKEWALTDMSLSSFLCDLYS